MAKTYKVSTVEVSAQSRKEWLARRRGKGEVAASAAAVVVQSEASSAPSALDALFRQVNVGTDDAPKYVAEALFPLRIGDALLDWHADQKYLGVEHAIETEKANFFATGGVTAGGIGSSSGGSGGGGSSTLAGLNDVALKSAIANDMLVYNGTHWVNTPMSAIKPDLTAYATTAEVANTYATKTALQGVDIRVQAIEYIFEKDQDGVINKWSEIVDFLAGVEGTTLDSILEQFATKTDLSSYLPKAGGELTGEIALKRTSGANRTPAIKFVDNYWTGYLYQHQGELYWGHNNDAATDNKIIDWANIGNYALKLSGGTLTGDLYIKGTNTSGFGTRISNSGSIYTIVPDVSSTSSWARGYSIYDAKTDTYRQLIGSFGDSEGNKYDYLCGSYDNHVLQLRLSDKHAHFYGNVQTSGRFIGDLTGNATYLKIETGSNNVARPIVFQDSNNLSGDSVNTLRANYNVNFTYNPASATLFVGNISSTNLSVLGAIDNMIKLSKEGNAALHIQGVTANTDYIHLFVSNLDPIITNRPLVFQYGFGNVGIGIPNPAEKLEVAGKIVAKSALHIKRDADEGTGFKIENISGTSGYNMSLDGGGSYLSIRTNDGSGTKETMYVGYNGVVIRMPNPTSELHVVGGARITDSTTIEKNLFVDKNIYIAESSSDGGIYFGDDEYAFIKETPDDVMTIASNQGLILKVNHISDEGAVIKLDGPVRIGDAILSWDATNKCVTIKNANTGEKASLFVDGGVTGRVIN